MVGITAMFDPKVPRLTPSTGSRGPAVLDDFTSSYGYKFSDAAGRSQAVSSAYASDR